FDLAVPSAQLGIEGHSRRHHFGADGEASDEHRDNAAGRLDGTSCTSATATSAARQPCSTRSSGACAPAGDSSAWPVESYFRIWPLLGSTMSDDWSIASMSLPVMFHTWLRAWLSQRSSGVPDMNQLDPLSARMIPCVF